MAEAVMADGTHRHVGDATELRETTQTLAPSSALTTPSSTSAARLAGALGAGWTVGPAVVYGCDGVAYSPSSPSNDAAAAGSTGPPTVDAHAHGRALVLFAEKDDAGGVDALHRLLCVLRVARSSNKSILVATDHSGPCNALYECQWVDHPAAAITWRIADRT